MQDRAPSGVLPGLGPGPSDWSQRSLSPPIRTTVPGAEEGEGGRDGFSPGGSESADWG